MSIFEEEVVKAIKSRILSDISDAQFVSFGKSKLEIPKDIIKDCWDSVDVDALKKQITKRLEEEITERVINFIITEVSNDVKKALSDKNTRENVRQFCKGKISNIINGDK
jgi:hypothetical protein